MRLFDQIEDFSNRVINLINANIKYYKIAAFEQVVTVISLLISRMIILMAGMMASLFMSLALAYYIGELLGDRAIGFLVVSAMFIVVGWIIYANRHKFIIDPLVRELGTLIEKQDVNEDEETE